MLQKIGDSLWVHEQVIRFGGLPLRHQMSVIRLAGGSVLVHSPTKVSTELSHELEEIGPVSSIIAPTWWHDLYLRDWLHAFPAARLYGASALVKYNRSLAFAGTLTNSAEPLWAGDLEQHYVEGLWLFLDEVGFYHAASRSLILADLLFNIDEKDERLTKALSRIFIGPFPGCRFPRLYRPFVRDARRLRAAIARILEWDFDRIVVGHGAVVERGGKEIFRSSFRWLLR